MKSRVPRGRKGKRTRSASTSSDSDARPRKVKREEDLDDVKPRIKVEVAEEATEIPLGRLAAPSKRQAGMLKFDR